MIFKLIESGALHLSALVLLRDHLTQDNHAELLREASGKGKHEGKHDVQALLAVQFPKPDVESRIRKLPSRTPQPAENEQLHLVRNHLQLGMRPNPTGLADASGPKAGQVSAWLSAGKPPRPFYRATACQPPGPHHA